MNNLKLRLSNFKATLYTRDELREQATFYKHLVELSPEAIVIHSHGRIVYINPAAVKLVGAKKASDIVGRPVMDFIHPDSLLLIKERIKKMISKQKVAPYVEEKFITLNGEIIVAETKAVPFVYQGEPAILAILHNITDRKKEEERQAFLNKFSKKLSTSIDYKTTLDNIGKSIVPKLADYSRIVLIEDGQKTEVLSHHISNNKLKYVQNLYEKYKKIPNASSGIDYIIATGKSEIIERVSPLELIKYKTTPEIQKIVKALNVISYIGVPLKIQRKVIGAITFSSAKNEKIYTKDDLCFFEEVAMRIAYAIEHARLYQQKQIALAAQKRLGAIVASSNDAIISLTLDGIINSWNSAAEKIFGYIAEESIGQPISIILPKHLINEEKDIMHNLKKENLVNNFETIRKTKDGKQINVSLTVSPIKNSKGKMVGYSKIIRDITEKKKALNELAHLASLVESSSDAIWSRTLDHKILSWNKGAESLYGFSAEEAIGHDLTDLVVPVEKKQELDDITKKVLRGEQIHTLETIRITKDKRKVNVSITISPLKDEQGTIIGISAIVRNITEQKEQERIKDEFISMASHELKTPITSMKMFLDILYTYLWETQNEKAILYVNRIKDQANKIRDLVNDLLDVSRIETGKLRFNNEKFQLETILQDTIDGMQPAARKHQLLFNFDSSLYVYGDRFRLYQVITNLLSNAIKYSPQSDKIIISAKKIKNEVVVSVKDFGIGIVKNKQRKIFEKLYQVTDPEEKTFPGLGMGLYISNEIIKRHNGKMWVESEKGKGSIFYFSLPYKNN